MNNKVSNLSEVDKYLEKLDKPQRDELERIRRIVKNSVPDSEEVISYGMPGFKYNGHYLLGYAAFKNHLSLFPTSGPIENLKEKLGKFKLAKGTIQFSIENPIPDEIIKEIIADRLKNIN